MVFDNQSHKLFIISTAGGIGFITFIRKVMKTKIILMILLILSNLIGISLKAGGVNNL
jgi:hypothetical protein